MTEEQIRTTIQEIWHDAFSMGIRKIKTGISCVSICYEYFAFTGDWLSMNNSGLLEKGWVQGTQQIPYFTCWVNHELKVLLSYAEGSIYWIECPNIAAYNTHLKGLIWLDNISNQRRNGSLK